ncbi:hypothetical protein FBU30_000673, partial [Linnemannia zychae]
GDVTGILGPNEELGWRMVRYSHAKDRKYYSCVGSFECTQPGCSFRVTPKPSSKTKVPDPETLAPKQAYCRYHPATLIEHIVCYATVQETVEDNRKKYLHSGEHTHRIPIEYENQAL